MAISEIQAAAANRRHPVSILEAANWWPRLNSRWQAVIQQVLLYTRTRLQAVNMASFMAPVVSSPLHITGERL